MKKRNRFLAIILAAGVTLTGPALPVRAAEETPERLEPVAGLFSIPELPMGGLGAEQAYTILVVKKDAALDSVKSEEILYIDQQRADASGNVSFPGFELREEADAQIYLGGDTLEKPSLRYYIEADRSKVLKSLSIGSITPLMIPKAESINSEVPAVTATSAAGTSMTPPTLVWSIDNAPYNGIAINEETGVLTVWNHATPATITIRATCGPVFATQQVEISERELSSEPDATITGMPASVTLPYSGGAIMLQVASGETYTYQWQKKTKAGSWIDIKNQTAAAYAIPAADVTAANSGNQYQCKVTNVEGEKRPNTAARPVTLVVNKSKQGPPSGLAGIAPTVLYGKDGKITGLDSTRAYNYKKGQSAYPYSVSAGHTEITGLEADTYYIRLAETNDYLESPATAIVVPEEKDTVIPVSGITGFPTSGTVGTPLTLAGKVTPENATNRTIQWSIVNRGSTGAVLNGAALLADAPGTVRIKATVLNGAASGDYTKEFDVKIEAAVPAAYPVTVEFRKDGGAWNGHGKTVTLRKGNLTIGDLGMVENGAYQVLVDGQDTGTTVTVQDGPASAALDYYTVSFAAQDAGLAQGSSVTAQYDGAPVSDHEIVLGGKRLVLTAAGQGAAKYAYAWSSGETTASIAVEPLDRQLSRLCTVTGSVQLSGNLALNGQARFGETLSPATANLEPAAAVSGLDYAWTRGTEQVGAAADYTLTEEDIGKRLTLTVTGSGNYYGSLSAVSAEVEKADRPAPTGVGKTDETAAGANDGTLTGVTAEMQYARDGSENWVSCGSDPVTGLAPGNYQVRYRETATHYAGASVSLHILAYNAPAPAETPRAVFQAEAMRLTGVEPGMKYSVDGGKSWEEVQGASVALELADLSVSDGIQIYRPGDGTSSSDSDIQTILLTQAAQPSGLSKSDATSAGAKDGVIRGVSSDMEYQKEGAAGWTAVVDAQITGLAAGDYLVRTKGAGTTLPSQTVQVTIGVFSGSIPVTGIRLSTHKLNLYSNFGAQSQQLSAVVLPENAADKTVTWTSSNTGVAAVSDTGMVSVKGNGTASVIVQTKDGGFTDTCTVHVSTYSNHGGNGGGGGDTAPAEPDLVIETVDGETTAKILVDGGANKFTIDRGLAQQIAEEAAKKGARQMTIAPVTAKGQGTLPVELTTEALDALWSRENASLTIQTESAGVTLRQDNMDLENGALTVSSKRDTDGKVTVSVKKAGNEARRPIRLSLPEAVGNVAMRVLPDGTKVPIRFSKMVGGKMCAAVDGSTVLLVEQKTGLFRDTEKHWAKEQADFAAAHNLFLGAAPNTFSPQGSMTRGALITVLHRLAEEPENKTPIDFPDVADNAWYTQAVQWGTENGLIFGMDDGKFHPNGTITRSQFVSMLHRYAKTMDMDTAATENLTQFKDKNAVPGWAEDAVKWAVSQKILYGRTPDTLAAGERMTRAEAAAMLERFIEARLR